MTEKGGEDIVSSYVMHICISNIIKNKYNLSSKYIYGSVLPDIKKNLGCDRSLTHFTEKVEINGDIRYLPQIEKAIQELKDKMEFEVYLGYISHLIEDYIWFNDYIPQYTNKTTQDKVIYLKDNTVHSLDEYRNDVYSDYRYFAKYMVNKYGLDLDKTINELKDIINKEENHILIQNTMLNVRTLEKEILITKESLDEYVEKAKNQVEKFVSEQIKNYENIECKV